MILKIEKTPDSHDSNQFWIFQNLEAAQDNDWIGSGWMDKKGGVLRLRKCPKDGLENYFSAEATTGACFKCGFNPNKEFAIGMDEVKNLKIKGITIISNES